MATGGSGQFLHSVHRSILCYLLGSMCTAEMYAWIYRAASVWEMKNTKEFARMSQSEPCKPDAVQF